MQQKLFFLLLSCVMVALAIKANSATNPSTPLFFWKGERYTLKNLSSSLKQSYYEIEMKAAEAKQQLFDEEILKRHIQEIATQTNNTFEKVYDSLASAPKTTEMEAKAMYESVKHKISATYEEVEDNIKRQIQQNKKDEKIQALIEQQKKKGKFISYIQKPIAPIFNINTKPFPTKGNSRAPVKLVEFADYRCGYCKRAKSSLEKLSVQYKDKIQIISIDFPLLDGLNKGISTEMSKGGYCANKQQKYWEYNTLAYQQQSSLDMSSPENIAKELNLNLKDFKQCMAPSGPAERHVKMTKALASEYAIYATPTFFVNGAKVNITKDFDSDLRLAIDEQLKLLKL